MWASKSGKVKNCSQRFWNKQLHFFVAFVCEKQENLLDFFRRCFLALVFFLSGNFFVKATLRNWKKKKCWMVTVPFFFVSCPAKHLFDIQRLDSAFLKYSFAPPRLMGSDKPCWWILFHGHLFHVFFLFGQTCLEKTRYQQQPHQVFVRYQNDIFLVQKKQKKLSPSSKNGKKRF